jgi:hypothetical protein
MSQNDAALKQSGTLLGNRIAVWLKTGRQLTPFWSHDGLLLFGQTTV